MTIEVGVFPRNIRDIRVDITVRNRKNGVVTQVITGTGFILRCVDDPDKNDLGGLFPFDDERYILTTMRLEGLPFELDTTTPPPFPCHGFEFGGYVKVKSCDVDRVRARWDELADLWNAYHDYFNQWKETLPAGDLDEHDPVLYHRVKSVSRERFAELEQQVLTLLNPTNEADRKVLTDYQSVFAWYIAACKKVPYGTHF